MDVSAWGILAVKTLITPSLILCAVFVSHRTGAVLGGALAGLPFISGPASLFIAHEQGLHFASLAASGSLMGAMASCGYCLSYALCARYYGWKGSLFTALLTFFILSMILQKCLPSLWLLCILSITIPILCLLLLPRAEAQPIPLPPQPRWQLPMQMLCGSLAVVLLTLASHMLGELWSGIMLTFPIITSILTPFAHASYGRTAAILMIRGLLVGFVGTSAFIIVVATGLGQLGIWLCYCLAAVTAVLISALFFIILRCIHRHTN